MASQVTVIPNMFSKFSNPEKNFDISHEAQNNTTSMKKKKQILSIEEDKRDKVMKKYEDLLKYLLEFEHGRSVKNSTATNEDHNTTNDICKSFQNEINSIESTMDELYNVFHFADNDFHRIMYILKFTKDENYFISKILKNPFAFINYDYQLITFKKACTIKDKNDISIDLKSMTQAWLLHYFLREEGNHFIELWKVEKKYITYFQEHVGKHNAGLLRELLLKVRIDTKTLKEVEEKKFLKERYKNPSWKEYYTTKKFLHFEKELGDDLMDMYYGTDHLYEDQNRIKEFIDNWELEHHKTLTSEQRNAVTNGISQKFHMISGLPGTGKSTILNIIIEYKIKWMNILQSTVFGLAPTGLAMKNLMTKCGTSILKQNGMTIHKFKMYMQNPKRKNDPKHIIVDEASMMNIHMLRDILNVCAYHSCHLTLIGDCEQLSPIGVGTPFQNIISSEIFNEQYNYLQCIKRQSGALSNNIKKMHESSISKSDFDNTSMIFHPVKKYDNDEMSVLIEKYVTDKKDQDKTQIILSQNSSKKSQFGIHSMNKLLQRKWNPYGGEVLPSSNQKAFCIGDLVCRCENSYEDGTIRVNGDVGNIVSKDHRGVCIDYHDDDEPEFVSVRDLHQIFNLHYAASVHKMQGSEMNTVIIIIHPEHEYMWWKDANSKKLLYTAISRATEKCVVIGDYNLFKKAQEPKRDAHMMTYFMRRFDKYDIDEEDQ